MASVVVMMMMMTIAVVNVAVIAVRPVGIDVGRGDGHYGRGDTDWGSRDHRGRVDWCANHR